MDLIRVDTRTGSGLFTPEQVRALLAKSQGPGGIPAPRPLSPRARAFVAQAHAQAAGRRQAMEKAAALGVDVAKAATQPDMIAVYDQDGNLYGCCSVDAVTPVAPVQAPGGPQDAAKAMSRGAQATGQQQLGGPQPRGGVPTVPAQDAQPAPVTKEQAHQLSADLKKALNGGRARSAPEVNRVADAMQRAALTKFADMQRRGLAPGPPRRP